MKLLLNLGGWNFSRGLELFWGIRACIWGWGGKPPENPSMLTMILTIIINNTFELLILRYHFIINLLKSNLKPDFTQKQRASKNIELTG